MESREMSEGESGWDVYMIHDLTKRFMILRSHLLREHGHRNPPNKADIDTG